MGLQANVDGLCFPLISQEFDSLGKQSRQGMAFKIGLLSKALGPKTRRSRALFARLPFLLWGFARENSPM
jgi:hypothetical protein